MSNTTFVAEVTAPSLAVLVPLLSRALNDRHVTCSFLLLNSQSNHMS